MLRLQKPNDNEKEDGAMKRTQGIACVTAGIMLGAAIAGNAAQAAEMLAAQRSAQRIYVNGQQVQMEAYAIGGSNYVKLRDIGKAMGFEVGYDAASNSVYIGEQPRQSDSRIVTLPTDGSKYTPKAGDLIPCDDGTLYEIRDVERFENNVFAPGPLSELPMPKCDWSLFPALELPAPEVRHFVSDAGDNLFIRNLYETRRMQYTLYNAIAQTPESWRDGKPLAKVFLTIPTEYEPYTAVFWPWRAEELTKHVANIPRGRFRIEAWDYYKDHTFLETRYYLCTV